MPATVKLPKKEDVPLNERTEENPRKRLINNVTFFGDSAIAEDDPIYKSVWDASKYLATKGYTIVNGGGPGIMKAATDGAESVNGNTVAIYWQPKLASFFEGKNLANITDESQTSSNYVMRTLGLIEKGDAYIVCKGGTGTISEFGLVWCLAKLYYGCHKPVILFGDFWDPLIEAFQKTMYIDEIELGVLYQATTPMQIEEILNAHETKIKDCAKSSYSGDEVGFLLYKHDEITTKTYDEAASNYHSTHAGKLVAQEQLDEFMSLVNPPAKVLDIGTGPGYDANYLSTKYSVTGIERSAKFFNIAKYESPNVSMIHDEFLEHDFITEKFKGIWARDSIHHLNSEDIDKAFKKISDLLVEEGILYVIVREGEGEIIEKEKKTYGELERFYHLFTAEELIDRAKNAGLSLVKLDITKRSHRWLVGVFKKEA